MFGRIEITPEDRIILLAGLEALEKIIIDDNVIESENLVYSKYKHNHKEFKRQLSKIKFKY